jgi:hypothetical protein
MPLYLLLLLATFLLDLLGTVRRYRYPRSQLYRFILTLDWIRQNTQRICHRRYNSQRSNLINCAYNTPGAINWTSGHLTTMVMAITRTCCYRAQIFRSSQHYKWNIFFVAFIPGINYILLGNFHSLLYPIREWYTPPLNISELRIDPISSFPLLYVTIIIPPA